MYIEHSRLLNIAWQTILFAIYYIFIINISLIWIMSNAQYTNVNNVKRVKQTMVNTTRNTMAADL